MTTFRVVGQMIGSHEDIHSKPYLTWDVHSESYITWNGQHSLFSYCFQRLSTESFCFNCLSFYKFMVHNTQVSDLTKINFDSILYILAYIIASNYMYNMYHRIKIWLLTIDLWSIGRFACYVMLYITSA